MDDKDIKRKFDILNTRANIARNAISLLGALVVLLALSNILCLLLIFDLVSQQHVRSLFQGSLVALTLLGVGCLTLFGLLVKAIRHLYSKSKVSWL